MMGTGEASGEKRALTAAEAAVSNPLLDEVSMRGAKGLLISITGGKDLTLYEVDEAATRIREEVDPDANIILGATFDQSLEGLIRVSVVATGIDVTSNQEAIPASGTRFNAASVAGRMAVARAFDPRRELQRAPAVHAVYEPEPEFVDETHEEHTPLAPEAAIDDVTIRPLPPRPSFFEPMPDEQGAEHTDEPIQPFLPPRPERPGSRAPRMPRIEELPMPAQKEIRASRGEITENRALERKRMSLLQRLAQVGLGRRQEKEPPFQAHTLARPGGRNEAEPRPAPERRPNEQVSEYSRRPAGRYAGIEPHGRTRPMGDDELEIPAFLRRQSN
jgi:cell division protein FtsZ